MESQQGQHSGITQLPQGRALAHPQKEGNMTEEDIWRLDRRTMGISSQLDTMEKEVN